MNETHQDAQDKLIALQQQSIASLSDALARQTTTIDKLRTEIAELRRMLFGGSRERVVMPPAERELRKRDNSSAAKLKRKVAVKEKRKENREQRAEFPVTSVEHNFDTCPECQSDELDAVSLQLNDEIEYVPGRFIRRRHKRSKKKCKKCGHIATAPRPDRVIDGGHYGPGVYAHVAVSKCADSIPVYRLAKQLTREGLPVSRSSLNDIFHRTAELLEPLAKRILELVAQSAHVNADETTLAMQAPEKCKRGYIWTFLAEEQKLVGYVYNISRGGKVPLDILGKSAGTLQVDGYTGYNTVIVPKGRKRVTCLAHIRRYFFKALETSPDKAGEAMENILGLYQVEYDAARQDILGTDKHLALRRSVLRKRLKKMGDWLDEEDGRHPPKSPIATAIGYAKKNWGNLDAVLDNPKVRLDNNVAENALRIIALGRKNFLFVGNEKAGENLAVVQTIISTCAASGVNPQAYISDVLLKLADTPKSKIDTLLPAEWVKTANTK